MTLASLSFGYLPGFFHLDIFFVREGEMDDEIATVDFTNVHLSSSNPVIFKLKSSQLDDFSTIIPTCSFLK